MGIGYNLATLFFEMVENGSEKRDYVDQNGVKSAFFRRNQGLEVEWE